MEYRDFHRTLTELLVSLAEKLSDVAMREIRGYVDHGEEELGVDYLAAVLLHQCTLLSQTEYSNLEALLGDLGQRDGDFAPYLFNGPDLLGALNVSGRPSRTRGVPALRGGHEPGSERGATEFPSEWNATTIDEAVTRILSGESRGSTRLANGRRLVTGVVGEVSIGVVIDNRSAARSAFPLLDTGLARSFSEFANKDRPRLFELIVRGIAVGCGAMLNRLADQLPTAEVEAYRQLQRAGELEELADALAASLMFGVKGAVESSDYPRMMLCGFDLPVPGCDYINDRVAVLARLRVG